MNNTTNALMHSDTMTNATGSILDAVSDLISSSLNITDDNLTTTAAAPRATPNPKPGYYLLTNTRYFVRAFTYTAYAIGVPGNLLTMIILARMRPFTSVQVWLIGLSFVDFLTLLVRGIITPLQAYGVIGYYDAQCIAQYISSWTSEYCNYLFFLSMTIERFIAVWFPLRMAAWTSPKKATIGMLTIFFVILGFQLHNIWTLKAYGGMGCFTRPELAAFWNDIWVDTIEAIFIRTIPLISVLVLNILIAYKLTRNKNIEKAMSDSQLKEKRKQQAQINRLLTAATCFTFFSLMPDILFRLTSDYWGDPYTDWIFLRDVVIVMNVFAALRTGNHAGNFLCYIVVAKKFRGELVYLVTCTYYGEHNGVKGSRAKVAK